MIRRILGRIVREILGRRIILPLFLASGTEASSLINTILKVRGLSQTYLEIGIENGLTLESVKAHSKTGVDPNPKVFSSLLTPRTAIDVSESDKFFQHNRKKFEFIYIDGLHTFEQALRDLLHSMDNLVPKGIILLDDTVPSDKWSALPDQQDAYRARQHESKSDDTSWHGDVFRVVTLVSSWNIDFLHFATVTDLQNPKTLFWIDPGHSWKEVIEGAAINKQTNRSFEQEFSYGIPEHFRPLSKFDLIDQLRVQSRNK